MINVITGETLWTSKDLGISDSRGNALFLPLMSLLVYGQDEATGEMKTVMADLVSGKPLWTKKKLFKAPPKQFPLKKSAKKGGRKGVGGNQPLVALPDGNFLEIWSEAGLRKIDAQTGEVLWTSPMKIKDVPAPRLGYAPILLNADSSIAYVPHDKTIDAIQLSDGAKLWKKAPKFKSLVTQMKLTPQGLIVRGTFRVISESTTYNQQSGSFESKKQYSKPYLTVIDPITGKSKWKKPFKKLMGSSSFVVQNDSVTIYSGVVGKSLLRFSLNNGKMTRLVKKVDFRGSESPDSLEIVDSNYLLMSDQNLMMIDPQGNTVYHNYHDAPGSGLLKFLAANWGGPSVIGSIGFLNINLGNTPKYQQVLDNPIMAKRFKALERAQNYVTVRTNLETGDESGAGLVKVDKTNGKDVKKVVLLTKKPQYLMDGIEDRLFFKMNDNTIICYSF